MSRTRIPRTAGRALLSAVLLLASAASGGAGAPADMEPAPAASPRVVDFRTRTMGTWATLSLVTADSAAVADLAYAALRSLHHTDSLMTNWTATSEVARLNRVAGAGPTPVHPQVMQVLATARSVAEASGGAFDVTIEPLVRLWGFIGGAPRVPPAAAIEAARADVGWQLVRLDPATGQVAYARPGVGIDLGGIAKGWGVDQVAALLAAAGTADALIDLSGNMIARGAAPGRQGWLVGIRDPEDRVPYLATVLLRDEAVATSGAYAQFVSEGGRRYGHILDPRTGWPAEGLLSATVVAASGTAADAWATALFVLGPDEARRLAADRDDLAAVLLAPAEDGRAVLWVERDLADRVTLAPGSSDRVVIRLY